MHKIGLLGGLSWHSTSIYYKVINQTVASHLRGLNSAKIIINSINAKTVTNLLANNDWNSLSKLLINEIRCLERAEVDLIGLACNTVHIVYDKLKNHIKTPVIHIIDAVADELLRIKSKKVGILATKFTYTCQLYTSRLQHLNIEIIYPTEHETILLNNIIFAICQGNLGKKEEISLGFIVDNMIKMGCDTLVLGCTELGLAIEENDKINIIDSAEIHAKSLALLSMSRTLDKVGGLENDSNIYNVNKSETHMNM